ncbi:MAG TPA: ABC transporter permease [Chryseolinea sp.]|nr:ABC transporter permease [Chryseolinea sp.]
MKLPPKYALKFLRWFCREDFVEEIEGDLTEIFEKQYDQRPGWAKWLFAWSVLKYFRPEFIKSFKADYNHNAMDMFLHNLLLTFRSFKRYKSTFVINLIGLSTGLTCSLLIYFWVKDELSVDKFHAKDDQIYQAMLHHDEAARIHSAPDTPALLAKAMDEEIPEVEMATEDSDPAWFGDNFVISDGKVNLKMRGKFSGQSYFTMFSFDIIEGDPAKALLDKNSIVISEKLAQSLFSTTENVVGKSVQWKIMGFNGDAMITGVFKNIPISSTDKFDFALPFKVFEEIIGKDGIHWGNYNAITHVQLAKGVEAEKLNERIGNFIKKKAEWSNVTLFVRPFSDRYLYDKFENGKLVGGRILYVKLFSFIAVFIVIIACINFMNLATAKATTRSKEVGIKKTMGAGKNSLIYQYMGESMIVTLLSLLIAITAVILLLPLFNEITGKNLEFSLNRDIVFGIITIAVTTGLLSGSYPALYLSAFNPIAVLKGRLKTSSNHGELWARQGLVVFQFTLSILLIVSVIVVYQQVGYIQSKHLGYDRENVITFPNEGKAVENIELFLSEVSKIPGVVNASATNHNFLENGGFTTDVKWEGKDPAADVRFANATVYLNLIETLGIEMVQGRSFSKDFNSEKDNLILNETAVKVMGLKDPIGQTVKLWNADRKVIGVAKDFHFASLHEKVQPLFFRFDPTFLANIVLRIKAGEETETLDRLAKFYQSFNPGYSFDYRFIDQKYQMQYVAEMRVATLSRYFAGFAVLISCLGLFGLAAFTAERRLKEIGIRKVLGSSELGIVYLLSADFTKMVLVSIFIALPLSYFFTNNWLSDFAYRIDLEWWFFAAAGIIALMIAWLTVGLQTLKAAQVNPTECLRSE